MCLNYTTFSFNDFGKVGFPACKKDKIQKNVIALAISALIKKSFNYETQHDETFSEFLHAPLTQNTVQGNNLYTDGQRFSYILKKS